MAMHSLSGVSLDNNIFMTGNFLIHKLLVISHKHSDIIGGVDGNTWKYNDYILQFNPVDGTWKEVGQLQHNRGYHSTSLVNVEDVIKYCQ